VCAARGPFQRSQLALRLAFIRLPGPGLLSWGCHRSAPPSASAPGVLSQWSRCSEERSRRSFPKKLASQHGATFGPELPHSGLVPPLPFLPATTVCSTWHVSGLLHPETDHGVRQVAGRWRPLAPPGADRPQPKLRVAFTSSPVPRGESGSDDAEVPACALPKTSRGHSPRRGGPEASSNHSHWRSTLRSFPLAFSSLSSTAVRVRTPFTPSELGNPSPSLVRVVWLGHESAGHRETCLLAVGPERRRTGRLRKRSGMARRPPVPSTSRH